jgi:hypothetical protein
MAQGSTPWSYRRSKTRPAAPADGPARVGAGKGTDPLSICDKGRFLFHLHGNHQLLRPAARVQSKGAPRPHQSGVQTNDECISSFSSCSCTSRSCTVHKRSIFYLQVLLRFTFNLSFYHSNFILKNYHFCFLIQVYLSPPLCFTSHIFISPQFSGAKMILSPSHEKRQILTCRHHI